MKNIIAFAVSITVLFTAIPANAGDVVCADLGSQAEAQAYFNAKKAGYKRLDRDKDGIACESLR